MNERTLPHPVSKPPREIMPAARGTRMVVTGVIACALCAVLLVASNFVLAKYSSNAGHALISAKWELLESQERPVDVLVLGDSSANQGIDTEYLMAASGMSALNVATTAATGALNDLLMLERYIDRVGVPTCAIIGHAYDLWRRPLEYSLVKQIPVSDTLLRQRMKALGYGIDSRLRLFLARYLRAYNENESIKELLLYPWEARETAAFEKLNERFDVKPSGFYADRVASPTGVADDTRRHLDSMRAGPYVPAHENEQALKAIVDLAEKHEFRLYLANSALYSGLYGDEEFRAYLVDVNGFIADTISRSAYVTHLFAEPVLFDDDELESVDHLIATAARKFTRVLMREIDCGAP